MSNTFARIEQLFHQLSEAEPAAREELLEQLRSSDAELHARVVALLEADERLKDLSNDPTLALLDPERTLTDAELPTMALDEGDADPDALRAASAPVVPGFRMIRRLGEGGMGVVWEAEQLEPVKRLVAVKLIRTKGRESKTLIDRFKAEQQAQAMMDHPNIARVFEAGLLPDGRPYFVMELVEGEPISTYCDRHKLPSDDRLKLFQDVCRAVTHAHRRGVVHRDLKPSNILVHEVDGRPTVKVIDFGIAKVLDGERGAVDLETRMGDVIGTPAYMSPEQISADDPNGVDTRADVYSLGVVLFELLVGSLPHGPGTGNLAELLELRDRVVSGETPTPSTRLQAGEEAQRIAEQRGMELDELLRELKGELDWIVLKAMARDVDQRYDSPHALEMDIERFLNDLPVAAGPPHLSYRLRKWVERHRLRAAAIVLVAAGLGVGVVGLGWGMAEARSARAAAEDRADEAEASRDFLVSLFETSDEYAGRAGELSAVELVHRGAADLESGLERRPRLKATLLRVVASTYRRLGEIARARDYARRSVDAWTALDPDGAWDHGARAEALLEVGRADLAAGRVAEATTTLVALIEEAETAGADGQQVAAYAHADLAEALRLEGKPDQALDHAQRATALAVEAMGEHDARTAWIVGREGLIRVAAHDNDGAVAAWRRAIEILTQTRGELDAQVAPHLDNLSAVLRAQGRMAETEPLLQRLVEIDRVRYGPLHAQTARSLFLHGESLRALGRADEAASALTEALSIQRSVLGSHPSTALTLSELGLASFDQSRTEIAESLLREALFMLVGVVGEQHPRVSVAHSNLADVLRALGRLDEARQQGELALSTARQQLTADDHRIGLLLLGLADTNTRALRVAEARQQVDAARSLLQTVLSDGHLYRLLAEVQHAEVLIAEGQVEAAQTALETLPPLIDAANAGVAAKQAVLSRVDAALSLLSE